jgi:amino acid transporter
MDASKVPKTRTVFWAVAFACYWILLPLGNLFRVTEWNLLDGIVSLALPPLVLWMFLSIIFDMAEPYELDRVYRYSKIILEFVRRPFGALVALIGFIIILTGNPVTNILLQITLLLFGLLFVALGLRWYTEDLKEIKLPKSDTL